MNETPGQKREMKSPEEIDHATAEQANGVTRRIFNKVVAALGAAGLVELVSGGAISQLIMEENHGDNESHEEADHAKAEELVSEITAQAQAHIEAHPEMNDQEKALFLVDLTGACLFAHGLRQLFPGGAGHIQAIHYGALGALTALKYRLSDEEGRHHLVEESISTAKAFTIIAGTIGIAEGIEADLESAYEELQGQEATKRDKVAVMTMLASVMSPLVTTVGSASVIKKISNEIAGDSSEVKAACTSHISNLSGFILFGDPPFIAVCEKYGFAEGVAWQLKTMWPLAVYSLLSANYKIHLALAKRNGLDEQAAKAQAKKDTIQGLYDNVGVLAKMSIKSLMNAGKYFLGADQFKKLKQDPNGLQMKIGEVLSSTIANASRLPFAEEFDFGHAHDHEEGMTHGDTSVADTSDAFLRSAMRRIGSDKAVMDKLDEALRGRDYEDLVTILREADISYPEAIVGVVKDGHDNFKLDESDTKEEPTPYGTFNKYFNPLAVYDRSTDMNRIQAALGHNMADVVNVFPFQAGCVPFLIPQFQAAVKGLESLGLPDIVKESAIFFLIMAFSMVADNFVGCKIGLELFPEKPQIALIASIQGGSMTAIGNMANIAQFDLNTFPLAESLKMMGTHIDNVSVAYAWNLALDALKGMGIVGAPTPLKKEAHAALGSTRRDLFKTMLGRA